MESEIFLFQPVGLVRAALTQKALFGAEVQKYRKVDFLVLLRYLVKRAAKRFTKSARIPLIRKSTVGIAVANLSLIHI